MVNPFHIGVGVDLGDDVGEVGDLRVAVRDVADDGERVVARVAVSLAGVEADADDWTVVSPMAMTARAASVVRRQDFMVVPFRGRTVDRPGRLPTFEVNAQATLPSPVDYDPTPR